MVKKIGIDLRIFGISHGGIGRYCQELFPRILELDSNNLYYLFINGKNVIQNDLEVFKKYKNAFIIDTGSRHYSLSEQTSFLWILNKYNLDLVHFPNFNVPVMYKKPFVVTIHDMVHHKIGGAKKSHLIHFFAYKKVIEFAAKKSKKIITVSQYSKNDIANIFGIDRNKIEVTYEAGSLNSDVRQEAVDKIKKSYLLNKPYFLFVGVLERKKNIVSLTRGFDLFLQKYKIDMDLVIVGKTDKHYPEGKHKALDIKNSDHLVLTGAVEDRELVALYKGAYAFTSASLHEGFGLPGVEAMAFGLPLLVSNISVFNEVYDNAALYFNPLDPDDIAEKMNLLVRDTEFYKQIKEKSFARGQLFDWQKTAKETLKIYQQILSV